MAFHAGNRGSILPGNDFAINFVTSIEVLDNNLTAFFVKSWSAPVRSWSGSGAGCYQMIFFPGSIRFKSISNNREYQNKILTLL